MREEKKKRKRGKSGLDLTNSLPGQMFMERRRERPIISHPILLGPILSKVRYPQYASHRKEEEKGRRKREDEKKQFGYRPLYVSIKTGCTGGRINVSTRLCAAIRGRKKEEGHWDYLAANSVHNVICFWNVPS